MPACLVGTEACATAHHWARELSRLGHEVRLIAPAYANAYVRRNKNDAADAAATCEAVGRPNMRFVVAKTEAQQASVGVHKTRELLVKQSTMIINHLRGMMGASAASLPRQPAPDDRLAKALAQLVHRRLRCGTARRLGIRQITQIRIGAR